MNKYCQVCRFFDWKGHCQKGWNVFCQREDFEPSAQTTILNFLVMLDDLNAVDSWVLDDIENIVWKKIKQERS